MFYIPLLIFCFVLGYTSYFFRSDVDDGFFVLTEYLTIVDLKKIIRKSFQTFEPRVRCTDIKNLDRTIGGFLVICWLEGPKWRRNYGWSRPVCDKGRMAENLGFRYSHDSMVNSFPTPSGFWVEFLIMSRIWFRVGNFLDEPWFFLQESFLIWISPVFSWRMIHVCCFKPGRLYFC